MEILLKKIFQFFGSINIWFNKRKDGIKKSVYF